jgi:hypothetical protein
LCSSVLEPADESVPHDARDEGVVGGPTDVARGSATPARTSEQSHISAHRDRAAVRLHGVQDPARRDLEIDLWIDDYGTFSPVLSDRRGSGVKNVVIVQLEQLRRLGRRALQEYVFMRVEVLWEVVCEPRAAFQCGR